MLCFPSKRLLFCLVIFFAALLFLPSTVSAKVAYDNKGIYSEKLINTVQQIMNEEITKNPTLKNDKLINLAASRLAEDFRKRGTTYRFILKNLGPEERKVFKSNPTKGMLVVIDAAAATKSAENNYQDLWNGKGDAYRHGLWQGLSAFHTGAKYAKAFGDAHEADFPGSKTETAMDLYNNSVGRSMGIKQQQTSEIYDAVKQGIVSGKFLYIKNGKLISTDK